MRRGIIILISIAASAIMLWLALRDVPLASVGETLRRADGAWILLALCSVTGAITTRAIRWRGLLDNRLSLRSAFHIFNIATAINQLPLRAGEVARAILASRPGRSQEGVPLMTALTSVFIERLLDLLTVVLLIAFSLTRLPDIPESVGRTAAIAGLLTLSAFVALLVFARFPEVAWRVLAWLEGHIAPLARMHLRHRLEEVLAGVRPLTVPRRAAHAVLWTVIAWSFSLTTLYALTRALHLGDAGAALVTLSSNDLWQIAILTVPLVAFSIALPVSVAGVGPFQLAVNVGAGALGVTAVNSATLGILFQVITVLMYLIFGVIGMLAMGLRLGDVVSQPAPPEAAPRPLADSSSARKPD